MNFRRFSPIQGGALAGKELRGAEFFRKFPAIQKGSKKTSSRSSGEDSKYRRELREGCFRTLFQGLRMSTSALMGRIRSPSSFCRQARSRRLRTAAAPPRFDAGISRIR